MRGILTRNASTVASVDITDGAPRRRIGLINEARFKECCCPPICQWKSVFFWDCIEEVWKRGGDFWVNQQYEPDSVETIDPCTVAIYGSLAYCDADPLPEPPGIYTGPAPDSEAPCFSNADCPCVTVVGCSLPSTIAVSNYLLQQDSYGASTGCVGTVTFRYQSRFKTVPVLSATVNPCEWFVVDLQMEQRFQSGGVWGDWEDSPFTSQVVVKFNSGTLFLPSRWTLTVNASNALLKVCGSTPFGAFLSSVCSSGTVGSSRTTQTALIS